jgi:MFS family permease
MPSTTERRSFRQAALGTTYRRLWVSNAASAIGSGMTVTAIPLVAAVAPDSEVTLGVIAAAGIVPGLLFAIPAGIATDRFDRRLVLVWADLLRAAVLLVTFVAVVADRVSVALLAFAVFAVGAGETVYISASQAFVPSVVDHAELDEANGRLQAAEDVGREFVGPPLGSLAFSLARWLPFAADAISYLVSALVLVGIRSDSESARLEPAPDGRTADGDVETTVRSQATMRDAWQFFRSSRTLVVLCAAMFMLAMCGSAVLALLVLIVRDQLGVPDAWYGPILAVMALGATVAGLSAGRLRGVISAELALIGAVALNALAYLVLGATERWPVGVVTFFVWGFAVTFGNITSVGIRQRLIPAELLGRTMSLFRMALGAGGLIGALTGGIVAAATSPGVVAVAAGVIQIPVIVMLVLALPRHAGQPPAAEPASPVP